MPVRGAECWLTISVAQLQGSGLLWMAGLLRWYCQQQCCASKSPSALRARKVWKIWNQKFSKRVWTMLGAKNSTCRVRKVGQFRMSES